MKVTIESTEMVTDLDGVPMRVWQGKTASGVRIYAYISRIMIGPGQDAAAAEAFDAELKAHAKPDLDAIMVPSRLLL